MAAARSLPLLALALVLLAPPAAASAASGIEPLSPKPGATVATGSTPTFRMRVKGTGKVYVLVCPSRRKDRDGLICDSAAHGVARRSGGSFAYRPRFHDFPGFWLNTAGTYYWQAYRVRCSADDLSDCAQESAITRFRVG